MWKFYFYSITIISIVFSQPFQGFTVFTPMSTSETNPTTVFINNELEIIHTWTHEQGPASMPYLMSDSSIIYPYKVASPTMVAGGVGGGIQQLDWDGTIRWEYIFSDSVYQHHHDLEPLPNGNILIIVWERKTAQEAFAMGRETIENPLNEMWSSAILELNPLTGLIEWEWHLWDHLVQDYNPELPNYGVISSHPELFDINRGEVGINAGGPQSPNADWMHLNSIDFNAELDQIALSSRSQNEIFIIDHSTTTEEAASHSGGNSGMGGDFLYRWGNPQNYGRGNDSDRKLNSQHSISWITEGCPGAGNLILFNNFHGDTTSAVIEIITPFDENGQYSITDGETFGPFNWTWMYTGDFTTPMQGGVQRLPNGNTLITQTHTARILEVDLSGDIQWDFNYETDITNYWIARAQKYPINYFETDILGDINDDGDVNILDVITALISLISSNEDLQFDVNQDGYSDVMDVLYLKLVLTN